MHLGVVLVLFGTAGSVLNEERLENVKPGSEIRIHDYRLRYLTAEALPAQHYGGAGRASRSTRTRSRWR